MRAAQGGGLRNIIIPEEMTSETDAVGILICHCKDPTDPDPRERNTAKLHTWQELGQTIPILEPNQHFVASTAIFLNEFNEPPLEDQSGAPFLVALPAHIAQTRTLIGRNQSELTAELENKLKNIPLTLHEDEDPDPEEIYLKLFNLPPLPEYAYEEGPYHQTCDICKKTTTNMDLHLRDHIAKLKIKNKGRSWHNRHAYSSHEDSPSSSSESPPPLTRKGNRRTEMDLPTIVPAIIDDPETQESTKAFFNMKASTGNGYKRYVAPHFPARIRDLETDLDFQDIPEREFKAWATTYNNFVNRSALDYQAGRKLNIQIYNTLASLQQGGKRDSMQALKINSPVLSTHNVQDLTLQSVTEFFEAGRAYCFASAIEWTDYFHFCISARTVGEDIFRRLQIKLASKPNLKPTAITISTYIEKIILDLLPAQASYPDKFDQIVNTHQSHLTAANPSAEYTKQNIAMHAAELQYLHSIYQQAQGSGAGWTKEESATLIHTIINDLQDRIIESTKWKTILKTMYVTRGTDYRQIPRQEVLNDLAKIIETSQDRY
ncbi:MAG: hypothetical protein NZ777_12240, partial [Pseudomonadales bacterium]|nr:hypothetical protein [Pseudomonadales bacterium]